MGCVSSSHAGMGIYYGSPGAHSADYRDDNNGELENLPRGQLVQQTDQHSTWMRPACTYSCHSTFPRTGDEKMPAVMQCSENSTSVHRNIDSHPAHYQHQLITSRHWIPVTDNSNRATTRQDHRAEMLLLHKEYDMNSMHTPIEPFLGSMYWMPASPLPGSSASRKSTIDMPASDAFVAEHHSNYTTLTLGNNDSVSSHGTSDFMNHPNTAHPPSHVRFSIQTSDRYSGTYNRSENISWKDKLYPSLTTDCSTCSSTLESESKECHEITPNSLMEDLSLLALNSLNRSNPDFSGDILNYSILDDSIIVEYQARDGNLCHNAENNTSNTEKDRKTCARHESPQTPRRLFEDDEDESLMCVTPSRIIDDTFFDIEDSFVHPTKNTETIETYSRNCSNSPSKTSVVAQTPQNQIINSHENVILSTPTRLFMCHYPKETDLTNSLRLQQLAESNNTQEATFNNKNPTLEGSYVQRSKVNRLKSSGSFPTSKSLQASPNVATFYGHWGSCRERHVSTLPSFIPDKPIQLRVVETHDQATHNNVQDANYDFFSYDPYFSSGKYIISMMDNRPYGNGLFIRMGTQFMTLEDGRGCTLAAIKSRYTHTPSTVVYAPKPRFVGQAPSVHRLSLSKNNNMHHNGGEDFDNEYSRELYPWALIRKEGRTMGDVCTVHLVDEACVFSSSLSTSSALGDRKKIHSKNCNTTCSGMFETAPTFCGRHGFIDEWHTHTVVTRIVSNCEHEDCHNSCHCNAKIRNQAKDVVSKEVPCCIIIRDQSNVDAVDITIAPGIDPLLMICYLASHSKMDVEPIMGGF